MTIRIAIIGFGTIARNEHRPAIAASPDLALAAVVSPGGAPDVDVPCFGTLGELLAAMPGEIDAVSLCTPPRVRHDIAAEAMAAGLAVLLEKPPASTLGELAGLAAQARASGICLYAAWHSQHAPAIAPAAALLRDARIARLAIDWREDVRKWHPGQEWIWEPDGFGVLDTGINALSIATAILPERLLVEEAEFCIPAGRQAPIAARLRFGGIAGSAHFDWREQGEEAWRVAVETTEGRRIALDRGGARLFVDGAEQPLGAAREYPAIYARFADLAARRAVEVDSEPLRILADAALIARRVAVEPVA